MAEESYLNFIKNQRSNNSIFYMLGPKVDQNLSNLNWLKYYCVFSSFFSTSDISVTVAQSDFKLKKNVKTIQRDLILNETFKIGKFSMLFLYMVPFEKSL